MLEQKLCRRQAMLLNCIVQSGFVLNISGINIGALADKKLAQFNALNGVDKTSPAVEIGQFKVSTGFDQKFN